MNKSIVEELIKYALCGAVAINYCSIEFAHEHFFDTGVKPWTQLLRWKTDCLDPWVTALPQGQVQPLAGQS